MKQISVTLQYLNFDSAFQEAIKIIDTENEKLGPYNLSLKLISLERKVEGFNRGIYVEWIFTFEYKDEE